MDKVSSQCLWLGAAPYLRGTGLSYLVFTSVKLLLIAVDISDPVHRNTIP